MRIDGAYLYNLGANLHPIVGVSTMSPVRASDVLYPLFIAEGWLNQLLVNRFFGLRTCYHQGNLLLAAIRELTSKIGGMNDKDRFLEFSDVWGVKNQAQIFENILIAELGTADIYYAKPVGTHSTTELILDGAKAFPDDLPAKVPSAVFDIQEATRCLVFERTTACAFHLHRANEAVLRTYWDVVTKGAARPKQETMGAILGELKRRKKGTAKVRQRLEEIKNMHRNPIIHPEHTLDQKQAMALMGVIHASITYMLEAIPAPALPIAALTAAGSVTT